MECGSPVPLYDILLTMKNTKGMKRTTFLKESEASTDFANDTEGQFSKRPLRMALPINTKKRAASEMRPFAKVL